MMSEKTSRISGFYKLDTQSRQNLLAQWAELTSEEVQSLHPEHGLSLEAASHMIENAVGVFGMPFGIATNFLINGRDYLIPMVIEEPSVVAAVSNAARFFREGGGFQTSSDDPIMIGQIQVLDVPNIPATIEAIQAEKASLLAEVDQMGGSIVKRGGGARDLETRVIDHPATGPMLIIHLLMDTRDAMGANAINTAVEHLAPRIESLTQGRVNLRILSNLTDRRKARVEGVIPAETLKTEHFTGQDVVKAIVEAGAFAEADPYRAATHNKGVMNGIDAVVIATGNDWRAIEAGAHAYAARDGRYTSFTRWWQDADGNLRGSLKMPLSVGIVGGATRVHSTAKLAMKILNVRSASELAEIIVAVGLAQNLAAIRALATDGIQQGHMRMHARQIAVAAGASDHQVAEVAAQLIKSNNIRLENALNIVQSMKENSE